MNITKRRKPRSRKRPVNVFPPQISPEPRLLVGGVQPKAATLPRGEAAPDDDPFQPVRPGQIPQRVVQPHKRRLEGGSVKVGVRPNVDGAEVGAGAEVVFRQGSIAFPDCRFSSLSKKKKNVYARKKKKNVQNPKPNASSRFVGMIRASISPLWLHSRGDQELVRNVRSSDTTSGKKVLAAKMREASLPSEPRWMTSARKVGKLSLARLVERRTLKPLRSRVDCSLTSSLAAAAAAMSSSPSSDVSHPSSVSLSSVTSG